METEKFWREMFWVARRELRSCQSERVVDRFLVKMLTIAVLGMAAYVWLIHVGYVVVR